MFPDRAAANDAFSPATPAWPSASPAFALPPAAAEARARLAAANRALWTATLALMAAFMQVTGPAQRRQLAGRIACNLDILSRQDSFDQGCRATFAQLAQRWQARCEQRAPEPRRRGLMHLLF